MRPTLLAAVSLAYAGRLLFQPIPSSRRVATVGHVAVVVFVLVYGAYETWTRQRHRPAVSRAAATPSE